MPSSLADYILISSLVCELMLRLLPIKPDYSVLVVLRDVFDWLHNVLPNNTK
jgi:hypothetical protein